MGNQEKARNAADAVKGRTKEVTGRVTRDRDLEAKGVAERKKADIAQATEKVKDAFK